VVLQTPYQAQYSIVRAHDGAWSMQLGIAPGGTNTLSYSSIEQQVTIPGDVESATLTYWWYPVSSDLTADWFDVLVNDGDTWNYLQEWRSDAQSWQVGNLNLSTYAGRTITLRFRVYNSGAGGQTAVWLDGVSLQACTP
jgi:hypothetical protein